MLMSSLSKSLRSRAFNPNFTASEISMQLETPSDIFSVLLILGGDVVSHAVAQLAGTRVVPVAFSFGWVAYVVTALLRVIGEHRLLPPPDSPCKVINVQSGYVRDNNSWILARIMRDFETWMDNGLTDGPIRRHLDRMLDQRWSKDCQDAEVRRPGASRDVPRPSRAGLCVSVFCAEEAKIGYPGYDLLYYMGIATVIVQLTIAAIPIWTTGDWGVMLVTAAGTILSFVTASLRQWSEEKWACRRNSHKSIILTRGNGAQHAIIILGTGKGLDLEDLASGPIGIEVSRSLTAKLTFASLTAMWIMLLIIAAGIRRRAWFLLATGCVGICENIFAAESPRRPDAFGVHLAFKEVIGEIKVMDTLFAVEKAYPHAGQAMLDIFFPGRMAPWEQEKWEELRQLAHAIDESQKASE